MIIGFLPMFSAMNNELEKLLRHLFPIMSDRCLSPGELENSVNSWLILLINFLVLSLVFCYIL